MSNTYEEEQQQKWMAYLNEVYNQPLQEKKMPVINDNPLTIVYDRLYDSSGIDTTVVDKNYEDPFWGAFEHAIKMLEHRNILSDEECDYWFDFVEAREYPTEDELEKFVNICKENMEIFKKALDCAFIGLRDSIENIEGFWPYA